MLPPIKKPTLLVDEIIVRRNIRNMAEKASRNHAILRPHFKTHQSSAIGDWFLDAGVSQCTVSSVEMARYFIEAGWKDITIAFPYNPLEADEIQELANEIKLNILICSKYSLDHLNQHVNAPLDYYLKVDVGTHRTGILSTQTSEIKAIAQSNNSKHRFAGLLAHAGHSYTPLTPETAKELYDQAFSELLAVKEIIGDAHLKISYGDTPTCSLLDSFPNIYELRPGNFSFYDVMQYSFNSCELTDIAVCLACPVVSVHEDRNEAVVYGGAVHLSKDMIVDDQGKNFGLVVSLDQKGWSKDPIARVDRLSQEHGIIKGPTSWISSLKPGELVGILPVHSCLTADLQPYYVSLTGEKLDKLNKCV